MLKIRIDRDSPIPPYQQLANQLRDAIAKGRLLPGRRIPSIVEIEQATGLARGTIQKATNLLKEEGLIEFVHGMGLFVADPKDQG